MTSSILFVTADQHLARELPPLLTNYPVILADTSEKARTACMCRNIHLAILDHQFSDDNAFSLFHNLRARRPDLAGLLLTATADNTLLRSILTAGFSGIIEQPLQPELVRQLVQQIMEHIMLREENSRLRTLLPLYSLGERFLAASSEQEILDILLEVVRDQSGAAHISIMLYDEKDGCLRIAASHGLSKELARTTRVRPGDQIAGRVFSRGRPLILNREELAQSSLAPLLKRPEITSAISFPMVLRNHILGVVNISLMDDGRLFSESDTEMLAIVCGQAALAIDNIRSITRLKETVRTRTLFEQYVSKEVADLLLTSERNLLDLGQIQRVTVLFADIRNFTCLVQHLQLQDLRLFLNEFFQLFTDTIFEYKGTVDKFIGDAVLAVFGAPVELNNANLQAARAARRISILFKELRERWFTHYPIFEIIDLGIGITCGEIFFGNVGSPQRLDYTVIGNEVNIAQRLAAESCSCRIYITEAVKEDVESSLPVERVGRMQLRGVDDEITIFSVKRPTCENRMEELVTLQK